MRRRLKRKLFWTRVLLLLLFVVLINDKGNEEFSHLLTAFRDNVVDEEETLIEIEFCYEISDEEEWKRNVTLEEKVWQLQCVADDCLEELGVTSVPVKVVTALEPAVLGSYSEIDKIIYVNKEFLENSTIQKAVHVIAHECHHRYQHAIIQSLMILEEADFPYEKLGYYQDAVKLLEGAKNYAEDRNDYYTYLHNEMEIQAEAYAEETVSEFAVKYGWERQEAER